MKRRLVLASALATTAAIAVPSLVRAQGTEQRRVAVAVGGKTSFFYLPFVLGETLGYFKDEGLDLTSLDFSGGSRALQAVVGGSADVVSGAFDHVIELQPKGQYFRAFGLQGRTPTYALAVAKPRWSQVKSAADLKGMKIGVTAPGSSTHMFVNLVLARAGLKSSDVSIIASGQGAQAMAAVRAGNVDAIAISDPVITMLVQAGDIRVLADARTVKGCTEVFGGLMPAGCLHASESYVQKNPDIVQALANGLVRVLHWIVRAGPSDLVNTMPQVLQLGDRKLYIDAFNNVRETYSPDGIITDAAARTAARSLATIEDHIDPARIEYGRLYTNEFVQRSAKKYA